jgi:phosphoribosylaminoimidazole carboxylase
MSKIIRIIRTIGIVGGGQLGRMLIEYGFWKINPSLRFVIIDPAGKLCSCAQLKSDKIEIIQGSLYDTHLLNELISKSDVYTFEIEHFATTPFIANTNNIKSLPDPNTIELINHKISQKRHLESMGVPVVPWKIWTVGDSMILEKDSVLKCNSGGYDGLGVFGCSSNDVLTNSYCVYGNNDSTCKSIQLEQLAGIGRELLIEDKLTKFHEISVIVGIQNSKVVAIYEPVLMMFHNQSRNILDSCVDAKSVIPLNNLHLLKEIAVKAATSFNTDGIYAVELFYMESLNDDNEQQHPIIYVNEIAPRVHNSGHHTIHSHSMSQFELQARLLLQMSIDSPIKLLDYKMINVLGPHHLINIPYQLRCKTGILPSNIHLIDYQKDVTKPWRKIGHITETYVESSLKTTKTTTFINNVVNWIVVDKKDDPHVEIGIVMGSKSDYSVMKLACDTLTTLGIPYEVSVVSAHRTPERLREYALTAENRGIQVIIAGAGGAAHLPGMLAANTMIPVIGVPIQTSTLQGIESLYSIVQMPAGIPVGCMAINGAKNAALYAVAMLPKYRDKLREFRETQRHEVEINTRLV